MADGSEPYYSRKRAPPNGAVCVVLRAETRAGADGEFAALMSDLAHAVRAEEQGCSAYVVMRTIGSEAHFAVHAHFADWASFKAHADTPHLTRLMPRLNALLATPVSMEIFLEVSAAAPAPR